MWLVSTAAVGGNLPFRLEAGEYLVGRTKASAIVIRHATVSRRHARFQHTRGKLILTDLDSCNGTYVNDRAVARAELQIGDRLRFGGVPCLLAQSPLTGNSVEDTEPTYRLSEPAATTRIDGLTAVQSIVATYLLEGHSEAEIAARMNKSRHTIHTHMKAIFARLGVHTRADLILQLLKPSDCGPLPRERIP